MAERFVLRLRIEAKHRLAGFAEIGQNELEQIAFALTGIAEDENVAGRLVLRAAVKVHEDVRPELVPAEVQPLRVGLAGKVEGKEIGRAGRRQHTLILRAELICACGQDGEEALLLPQGQAVYGNLRPRQLHGNVGLQLPERVHAAGL